MSPYLSEKALTCVPAQSRDSLPLYEAPLRSGYRMSLASGSPFSSSDFPFSSSGFTCQAPFVDADGHSPVFFGSAIFNNSAVPCRIVPHMRPPCRVPYDGCELEHDGRYELLLFTPQTMELVRTSHGEVPKGRRPIDGGHEEDGRILHHALATINGTKVPGKTGRHLDGCTVGFEGREHIFQHNYEILCWKYNPPDNRVFIPMDSSFPPSDQTLEPPAIDSDGSPLYFATVSYHGIQPCKVGPHLHPSCCIPYGGCELAVREPYHILPFDSKTMKLVHAFDGKIPEGRIPVDGGYEEDGRKLYHALGLFNGLRVPGKVGEHQSGCHLGYGGKEYIVEDYEILCWR